MCWPLSDGSSTFIPLDEQPKHHIVQAFQLGKAQCATHSPLAPRPELDGRSRDVLRVLLASVRLRGSEMPRRGPPSVGAIRGAAHGLQALAPPQDASVLPPPAPRRSPLPALGLDGVPEPARMRLRLHKTPHGVERGAEPTPPREYIRAPDCHRDLLGIRERQPRMIPRGSLRLFFSGL